MLRAALIFTTLVFTTAQPLAAPAFAQENCKANPAGFTTYEFVEARPPPPSLRE